MRQLLANVLDIVSGQIDPMLQPYCEMPHVGGENIEAGTGHIVGMNTAKELGLTSGKYLFSNEHVLYSKIRPNLNKVALPSSEGICSADIYPLQPKPGVLAREFLAHLLRSADFLAYAQRHSSRTSIPKLNRQSLLGYQALLPPLPEQRRIAEVLDRAEALRAKRRAALAKLDTLTQAIFLDMFGDPKTNPKGWRMEELGQVADFYAGTTLPDGQPFQGQTTGVFLVKVSDMNLPGNEGELRSCRLWSPAPGVKAATCPKDTIVIPKRGGAIGTNKKRLTVRRSVLDPNLMGIAARPAALTVPFLLQWFHGFDLASITSGSSVPQLNKKDLAPLRIVVPPLSLQHEFSCRMSAVERVKEAHRASLAKLDALFASLQHRAFRGEL